MVWLTSQSIGVLVAGCLGIAFLVAVVSRVVVRAFVPESEREAAQGVAAPLMSPLGATFAILAALTLANEAGYLSSAQQIVSGEAGDASRVAWASTMPAVRPEPIQTALRSYLLAVRTHEWHGESAAEGNDPQTMRAVGRLERVVGSEASGARDTDQHRAPGRPRLPHERPPIGGLTVVVGLSLALILVLGNPWRGTAFVSGHPVGTVIHDIDTGYFRR